MNRSKITSVAMFAVLVGFCAVGRLVEHPWNCTPTASVALFGAFWFRRRLVAALIPWVGLAASDLLIGSYDARVMAAVYASAALPVLARGLLGGRWLGARVVGCAIGSSIAFFLITNLAVWWAGTGVSYPHTPAGLVACYVAAAPFFQWTLAGDLFWSLILFGTYALATRRRGSMTDGLRLRRMSPDPVPVRREGAHGRRVNERDSGKLPPPV